MNDKGGRERFVTLASLLEQTGYPHILAMERSSTTSV